MSKVECPVLRYGVLEGVLEGVLCGAMIDSSIVFLINGLGAVPTPRNTALFQSLYRQSRPTGYSQQEQQKTTRMQDRRPPYAGH